MKSKGKAWVGYLTAILMAIQPFFSTRPVLETKDDQLFFASKVFLAVLIAILTRTQTHPPAGV